MQSKLHPSITSVSSTPFFRKSFEGTLECNSLVGLSSSNAKRPIFCYFVVSSSTQRPFLVGFLVNLFGDLISGFVLWKPVCHQIGQLLVVFFSIHWVVHRFRYLGQLPDGIGILCSAKSWCVFSIPMHSTFGNCAKTLEIALIEGQILGKRFVQDVCICSVFMAPCSSSSGMYFLILLCFMGNHRCQWLMSFIQVVR